MNSLHWLFECTDDDSRMLLKGFLVGSCVKVAGLLNQHYSDTVLFGSDSFILQWDESYQVNTLHPEVMTGAGEINADNVLGIAVMCYLSSNMIKPNGISPLTFSNEQGEEVQLACYEDVEQLAEMFDLNADSKSLLRHYSEVLELVEKKIDFSALPGLQEIDDAYF